MASRLWLAPLLALLVVITSCDRTDPGRSSSAAAPAASAPDAAATIHCKSDPSFPRILPLPEASAAAEVEIRTGLRELLVVADSDHHGAALAYALPEGPARTLTLPLDPRVADDVEGIAWYSGHLYAVISTGYLERFTPRAADAGAELARDMDAYAVGAPPFVASWKTASDSPPDFEGLCLRAPARTRSPGSFPASEEGVSCAGYAASRAYGWLVCLVFDGDRLRVSPDHPRLALDVPKQSLSDCAFGDEGGPGRDVLLVTTNIRGGSTVSRVDEASGALTPIDVEGTLNNEAIAIDHDGRLYQMMDPNGPQSPAVRATCERW